ncbi:hypothetical protein GWI33_022216 [Rhynchophorus ferrugineus]|uniref:Uncharacterized protein n=1 Tax=Rhynchophorus ferrugineus TaxID=354439 RepID=A0A834IQM2_RHYFE|nr:hypothetical protein GWI33_022216 [Rhynchophorus ferrugineus]
MRNDINPLIVGHLPRERRILADFSLALRLWQHDKQSEVKLTSSRHQLRVAVVSRRNVRLLSQFFRHLSDRKPAKPDIFQSVNVLWDVLLIQRLQDDVTFSTDASEAIKCQDVAVDPQNIKTSATLFYKASKGDLDRWCQFNVELETILSMAIAKKVISWKDIKRARSVRLEENNLIDNYQDTSGFCDTIIE